MSEVKSGLKLLGPVNSHSAMERQAALWEEAVVPIWERALIPGLLDATVWPSEGSALVAEARTGYVAEALVQRLAPEVRCVAVEANRDMLDIARERRVLPEDRRVWWESHRIDKLPYQDGVFSASICASGLMSKDDLHRVAGHLVRVTREGGPITLMAMTVDTFGAFYDMLREAMLALGLYHLEPALDSYLDDLCDPEGLRFGVASSGVRDARIHLIELPVTFRSGRDFVESPMTEALFMPSWGTICQEPEARSALFAHIAEALDTYFFGFDLTLIARVAWIFGHR